MFLKITTIPIAVSLLIAACYASASNVIITKAELKLSTCERSEYPKLSWAANGAGGVKMALHVSAEGRVLETRMEL